MGIIEGAQIPNTWNIANQVWGIRMSVPQYPLTWIAIFQVLGICAPSIIPICNFPNRRRGVITWQVFGQWTPRTMRIWRNLMASLENETVLVTLLYASSFLSSALPTSKFLVFNTRPISLVGGYDTTDEVSELRIWVKHRDHRQ